MTRVIIGGNPKSDDDKMPQIEFTAEADTTEIHLYTEFIGYLEQRS